MSVCLSARRQTEKVRRDRRAGDEVGGVSVPGGGEADIVTDYRTDLVIFWGLHIVTACLLFPLSTLWF